MNHIWSVISEKVTIGQDSNNLSLINIIEQLNISSSLEELTKATSSENGVVVPFNLVFTSLWVKEEEELSEEVGLELQLKIIDPEQKTIGSIENKVVVKENHKRIRTRFKLDNFRVTGSGMYKLVILKKENDEYKEIKSIPLDISLKADISN